MKPKAIVIVGYGINCDRELQEAFTRAGLETDRVHLNELLSQGKALDQYHILGLAGGFSFGDDTFGGNIFAKKIKYNEKLRKDFQKHLDAGKLIFGVCNGNQTGSILNLIPVLDSYFDEPETAYTYNNSARYEDRGNVHLQVVENKSHWLKDIKILRNIAVGHGEGKFYAQEEKLAKLYSEGLVALKYVHEDGTPANGKYPVNPNGSIDDIAGLASEQVLLMMPHPERAMESYNQDGWTRRKSLLKREGKTLEREGEGMQVFRNGFEYIINNF